VLRCLILQGLLIWFVLALNQSAQAHYAYSAACCNERDCAPVDDDDVVELPDNAGYKIKGVPSIIPRKHRWIQHPIDTQNHICRLANGNIRCVYPKANPF
jgi:non-ribosomal peptide synthetase component E (peptide arylation enzyme)